MDSEPTEKADAHISAESMPFDACTIVRIQGSDSDEIVEKLSDWTVELTHLRPGPFSGSFELIPLGPALIGRGGYGKAMVERCATPDGCISISRPGRGSDPLSFLGHQMQDDQVFVCGPDAEAETVGLGVRYLSTLSIRCELLEREADWLAH